MPGKGRAGEGGRIWVHTWRRCLASNETLCTVSRRCDTRLRTRSAHRTAVSMSLMAWQDCTAQACRSRNALVACGRRGSAPGRTRRRWGSRCAPIRPRPGHAAAYGPCSGRATARACGRSSAADNGRQVASYAYFSVPHNAVGWIGGYIPMLEKRPQTALLLCKAAPLPHC